MFVDPQQTAQPTGAQEPHCFQIQDQMRRNISELFAQARFEQRRGEHVQLANHRHHTYPNGWTSHGQPEQLSRRAVPDGAVEVTG
jgi:hypothetical protein